MSFPIFIVPTTIIHSRTTKPRKSKLLQSNRLGPKLWRGSKPNEAMFRIIPKSVRRVLEVHTIQLPADPRSDTSITRTATPHRPVSHTRCLWELVSAPSP